MLKQLLAMMINKSHIYATWDAAFSNASVTLSNGNLTYVTTATSNTQRSTITNSTGKWYFEWTCQAGDASGYIGICNSTEVNTTPFGQGANTWGYAANGFMYHSGGSNQQATWTTGDVVGIKLDLGAGTIEFLKNNVSQGTAFTGLSGSFYIACGGRGDAPKGTLNAGASAFVYSVPSGYNSGFYN